MAESTLFWDGLTTGDHGPYDDVDLCDTFFRSVFGSDDNLGILKGWGNELEVTFVAGLTVSVASGAALVHGGWYENTDAHTLTGLSDGDYVVVRRCWQADPGPPVGIAASATRLTFKAVLVQDAALATYWDIPLAQVAVAGGVITGITDLREFCLFSTEFINGGINSSAIQDDSMTVDKFTDQTRWITRGVGEMKEDSQVPATMTSGGASGSTWEDSVPYKPFWKMTTSPTSSVWATVRVPEDLAFTGLYGPGTVNVYLWTSHDWYLSPFSESATWHVDAWAADHGELVDYQAISETVYYGKAVQVQRRYATRGWQRVTEAEVRERGFYNLERWVEYMRITWASIWTISVETVTAYEYDWRFPERTLIGTLDVYHGDIIHFQIYADPMPLLGRISAPNPALFMLEVEYTADS